MDSFESFSIKKHNSSNDSLKSGMPIYTPFIYNDIDNTEGNYANVIPNDSKITNE